MTGSQPRLRRGTPDDNRACFGLFWDSVSDLAARHGMPWESSAAEQWPLFASLYDLLERIVAEWWVAEDPRDGHLVGYARSIERDGLFELSEYFVEPGRQSAGLGRQLLERAFPLGRGELRVIVATTDVRALSGYLRADTSVQFPILGMSAAPRADAPDEGRGGLRVERIGEDAADLDAVAMIERQVLGHVRGEELRWLLQQREGYLYLDGDVRVGFGFVGMNGSGPVAALDPSHLPEVLRHLEWRAHGIGLDHLSFEVPAPNVIAMRHLLGRGFRLDPFVTLLMANRPFGRLDRYLSFTPPFVL
jgi:GNAT superfamily N-acetyltransferase